VKAFAALTMAGVAGLVLIKIFVAVLLPVLGLLVGIVALTVKVALVAAIGFFVYSVVRKNAQKSAA
jgi:hypothetical protein